MKLKNIVSNKIFLNALVLIVVAANVVLMGVASAASSVWRVSKAGNELYLGGTIHVLSAADYPLPCEFDYAYAQADKLVFETDILAAAKPEVAQQFLQAGLYPAGVTIEQKLSPETFTRLADYLRTKGLPVQNMQQFKPGFLMSVLVTTEMQSRGITAQGVDAHFSSLALEQGKAMGQLETLQQQVNFISEIGIGNEEKFFQYLLDNLAQFGQQFDGMRQAWRTGDMPRLSSVSELDKMVTDFPKLFSALLLQRNKAWLPEIESMLQDEAVEYVLVGALHMVGEFGLLAELANRGYSVDYIEGCTAEANETALHGAHDIKTDDGGYGFTVDLSGDYLFEFDRDTLTADAEKSLSNVLRTYQKYEGFQIKVLGHTDSKGSDAYNLDLSQRRADRVYRWFLQRGLPELIKTQICDGGFRAVT